LMLPIIFLSIRKPKVRVDAEQWSVPLTATVFLGVGMYGERSWPAWGSSCSPRSPVPAMTSSPPTMSRSSPTSR
jgi:hypothetical protein